MSETIEDILNEMQYVSRQYLSGHVTSVFEILSTYHDRIESAYKRLPGMWILPTENAKLLEENERLNAALEREHSQTETAIRYEYAIQRKYKGEWQTESNGFKYIYDAKVNMNILRGIFPKAELRIVRRQADWEVVE